MYNLRLYFVRVHVAVLLLLLRDFHCSALQRFGALSLTVLVHTIHSTSLQFSRFSTSFFPSPHPHLILFLSPSVPTLCQSVQPL